jgi:urease accessory protein
MLKSKIIINAEQEGERTLLKESHHSAPYKVVHFGSRHLQKHLELILMSSSPGIMDEDEVSITVHVHEQARLKLFTQSFSKLHPMKKGAVQKTIVTIQEGGIFKYIPHPVTPFAGAIFKTSNEIEMRGSSTLIWGDIIASGRVHSGESFDFTSFHSITKVTCDKKLVLLDNQLLEPARQPVASILFYEGYTHQATLIYVAPFAGELKAELDEILVEQFEQIEFGFTQCAPNAVILRAMGKDGVVLHDWLSTMGQLCWEFTMHKTQPEPEGDEPAGNQHMADAQTEEGEAPPKARRSKVIPEPLLAAEAQ